MYFIRNAVGSYGLISAVQRSSFISLTDAPPPFAASPGHSRGVRVLRSGCMVKRRFICESQAQQHESKSLLNDYYIHQVADGT